MQFFRTNKVKVKSCMDTIKEVVETARHDIVLDDETLAIKLVFKSLDDNGFMDREIKEIRSIAKKIRTKIKASEDKTIITAIASKYFDVIEF